MSAERAVLTGIDLESGNATIETEISLESLFENDEWRLTETAEGWQGFEREELDDSIVYYYRDTTRSKEDWCNRIRVGENAILGAVGKRFIELDLTDQLREGSA